MSGNYYISGGFNVTCDVCSEKVKAHQTRQRWDGFQVCNKCFEERHPQDFIKVKIDKISVPVARPIQTPAYFVCTLDQCVAIAGVGVVGCLVSGRASPYER